MEWISCVFSPLLRNWISPIPGTADHNWSIFVAILTCCSAHGPVFTSHHLNYVTLLPKKDFGLISIRHTKPAETDVLMWCNITRRLLSDLEIKLIKCAVEPERCSDHVVILFSCSDKFCWAPRASRVTARRSSDQEPEGQESVARQGHTYKVTGPPSTPSSF